MQLAHAMARVARSVSVGSAAWVASSLGAPSATSAQSYTSTEGGNAAGASASSGR